MRKRQWIKQVYSARASLQKIFVISATKEPVYSPPEVEILKVVAEIRLPDLARPKVVLNLHSIKPLREISLAHARVTSSRNPAPFPI